MKTKHVPVMMTEALDGLNLQAGMTVVDATLGGGGYTRAICEVVGERGRVIAIDQDHRALEAFREQHGDLLTEKIGQVTIVHSNYSHVRKVLSELGISSVDAIVADLGFSSDQIEDASRGLSFQLDGPLDMRLDQSKDLDQERSRDAAAIVNHADEGELAEILRVFGDERYAGRIARAIVRSRPLQTTGDLSEVVAEAVGALYRGQKIHPATRTFQALRIAVNDEYVHLKTFLTAGISVLRSGGRMSIVSFHSGEDQIVKNIFRDLARGCKCPEEQPVCDCDGAVIRIITKKPLCPGEDEVEENPRARSAKLRICERK